MRLPLVDLAVSEVLGTESYNDRGHLPSRMRRLAPEAHASFVADLAEWVVVSDMFRSAEASRWAIRHRKGAQPPGWSGHNYGYCIDIDIRATMARLRLKTKRALDAWMAERGWFCHRRDHRMRHECWHFNYLGKDGGGYLREGDKRTNAGLQRMLKERFGESWKLSVPDVQRALSTLRFYGGSIDGDFGPLSRAACRAFQRAWRLTANGVPGPITQRTLAYVTADKIAA
jgi:hypothetical protein